MTTTLPDTSDSQTGESGKSFSAVICGAWLAATTNEIVAVTDVVFQAE